MSGHTARRFRVDWAVIACSLVLVLVACGGDGDTVDSTTRTAATAAPGVTIGGTGGGTVATEDFEPTSFVVEHAVWHSGFRIDVLEGELTRVENALSREERFVLTLVVSYENLGPHDTFFDAQMALLADGDSFVSQNFGGDSVGSGLSKRAEVTFQVEEGFDVSGAQLIIGSGDESRATIPFGRGAGEWVPLEPMDVAVAGTLAMELIDLEFTGGDLRHDVPAKYRQVDDGELALTLAFDATSRKGGNWSIFPQNFSLVTPGGQTIGIDGSVLENLPGADGGTLTSGLSIRFLVDDPAAGTYSVRFTPGTWFVGEDGKTEGSFEFTLD